MQKNMTYSEKLKHPKWQKKRLEILQRDEFACRECGNDKNTLHVHHGHYENGLAPWEYDDWTLKTLCKDCHEDTQATLEEIHAYLGCLPLHPHLNKLIPITSQLCILKAEDFDFLNKTIDQMVGKRMDELHENRNDK